MANKYYILRLSAASLVKNDYIESEKKSKKGSGIKYVNLCNRCAYESVVKSMDYVDENAYFYQLAKVIREREGAAPKEKAASDEELLLKYIILVDFNKGRDFENNKKDREKEKGLLEKGIEITPYDRDIRLITRTRDELEEGEKPVKFVPFDKSSSMARAGQIYFIDSSLVSEMNERLMLGMADSKAVKEILSKVYAYRGLYLSSSTRIPNDLLKLNEKKLIVIDNGNSLPFDGEENTPGIITACDEKEHLHWEKVYRNQGEEDFNPKKFKMDPFDGEGLISEKYKDILNEVVGRKAKATSFQVRLPFGKGMLHTVDWCEYITEHLKDGTDYESLQIRDAFGILRDLKDVEIIMTTSMFKCFKWLDQIRKSNKGIDPMKFYFDKFNQYDHALYVAQTDATIRSKGFRELNYQFISTMDLSDAELTALIKNHVDNSKELVTPEGIRRAGPTTAWEHALTVNPKFQYAPYVRRMLKQKYESQLTGIYRGHLLVKGDMRYLSGDLLCLLRQVGKRIENNEELLTGLDNEKNLYPDRFHMPKAKNISHETIYPLFRNPHLSRNAEAALRPYSNEAYKKYFGNLSGVLMVGEKSLAPATLGGADFDGDYVSIYQNEVVSAAVKRGIGVNLSENGRITRKLPIVQIPDM